MRFFKALKAQSQQGAKRSAMGGLRLRQALGEGGFEGCEVGIVGGIQALLFDELPQPLNQVEVRGIGRQKTDLKVEAGGEGDNLRTALRASLGEHHRQRNPELARGYLSQERTDLGGSNGGVVGNSEEFLGDRVERPQDVEALPARWGAHEQPGDRPEEPQEWREHEGRGIDKEDGALPRTGLGSARFHLLGPIARLPVGVSFGWEPPDTPTTELEFFLRNSRTWGSLGLIPVRASLVFWASLSVAGGCARKEASHAA
jgi:hypothetical protein